VAHGVAVSLECARIGRWWWGVGCVSAYGAGAAAPSRLRTRAAAVSARLRGGSREWVSATPLASRLCCARLSRGQGTEEAVPIHAVTVSCLMGLGGGAEFWCAQLKKPVKHRIGRSADLNRYQRDYLDSDELGTFF
jgi:hypothetical protein